MHNGMAGGGRRLLVQCWRNMGTLTRSSLSVSLGNTKVVADAWTALLYVALASFELFTVWSVSPPIQLLALEGTVYCIPTPGQQINETSSNH
jgi:hypothetical protein